MHDSGDPAGRRERAQGKPRPPWLRALGRDDPPARLIVDETAWQLANVLKHDSFAATALYRSESGREIACKFNRRQPVLGLPLAWLGNWLARREAFFYAQLADLACIPGGCGAVFADGVELKYACAHDFVPGAPLKKTDCLPEAFFDDLEAGLAALHARGIFLLDLNKRENIIVGRDGAPCLIDFQIAAYVPPDSRNVLLRRIARELERCDAYHLMKHRMRHSRGGAAPAEETLEAMRPVWVRMHRVFAQPLIRLRRWLLVKLEVRTGKGHAGSEHDPEAALRDDE
ncbi:MAG: hypothetical protein LBC10_01560 [Deltaproteobacteria bacterium]|jgi:hypothetical protein|nr:hypothetical protein [Deltaproteobacteria bacterium]